MVLSCSLTHFNTGACQANYTRDLYLNAREQEGEKRRYILKQNKFGKTHLSQMEVALTAVAGLFIQKNLSPAMMRVTDTLNETWGLASEHMCQNAAQKEGLPKQFWSISNEGGRLGPVRSLMAEQADDIPIYFLKDFAADFFANLRAAQLADHLSFDWDSLASVMASAYTLEEDDLHKGNLGFYLSDNNGRPHVVFFKIDHDLMMADSLMSREMLRLWNFFNNDSAFAITARDLRDFPKLHDSQNYYWPTRHRLFVNVSASQHYGSARERDAFANLATEPEFIKAKWRAFYKHILLSDKQIKAVLANHLDINDPAERAKLNLVLQTVVARQARLRAVLFSMPEFRAYVRQLSDIELDSICSDMPEGPDQAQVIETVHEQQAMCSPQHLASFCEGDTPLHVAIRLGDYRYLESIDAFKPFMNTANALGFSALDIAVQQAALNAPVDDFRKDAYSAAKHLLLHGAKVQTGDREALILHLDAHQSVNPYLERAAVVHDCDGLMGILHDIGEDTSLALKTRKDMAVLCVKHYIHSHEHTAGLAASLQTLKVHLNGSASQKPAPELDYIRQLRSQWWIVRYIRGLFGGTASQYKLNCELDAALLKLKPKSPSIWDFFKPHVDDDDLPDTAILSPK